MKLEDLNGKRVFDVVLGVDDFYDDIVEGRIAIDQKVFDRANEKEFKEDFYDLGNDNTIVAHVAYCMFILDYHDISHAEGFGGLEEGLVKVLNYPRINWQAKATEIDPGSLKWDE